MSVLDPPLASSHVTFSRLLTRSRMAISAVTAFVLGVTPHVLHHAGPLAGAALFAGIGGSLLFGALGLAASVPWLMRIRRRAGNWRVPGALLALFAAVFSLSTFVIGPALAGDDASDAPVPAREAPAARAGASVMIPQLAGLLVVAQDWEGHHDWGGGWWIVMVLAMLLFWALVVFGIVWAVRAWSTSRPTGDGRGTTPLEILDRRLADGSISVEEYEERRRALREPAPRPGADPHR